MSRRRIQFFLGLGAAVMLASCQREAPRAAEIPPAPSPSPLAFAVTPSREADDTARFLAGMHGNAGSPFLELQDARAWKAFAATNDKQWSGLEGNRLPRMREFQTRELVFDGKVVFYPFGGPDVLNVVTFFPGAEDYVLVGLEPPGTLPSLNRIKRRPLDEQLPKMQDTLDSVLRRSFFITRDMDHQLRGQVTDGLLAVMLVQLVRTHHTVLGYAPVTLDGQGKVASRRPDAPKLNRGVAIEYVRDADKSKHRILYFSLNLDNEHLEKNQPFLALIAQMPKFATMFKSTSYMTHRPEFSLICEHVLKHSAAIVQDDSGIPFKLFAPAGWNVQLYGEYDKPYGSFRYLQQPDLKAAYERKEGVRDLAFRIGYGYGKVPSNLQVARRKG